ELLVIGALMGMALAPTVILDDQIHLLDSFRPDNRVILPERLHRHILLVHPFFAINDRSGAAVAVLLPLVRDVAQRPGRRFVPLWLLDDLGTDVDRSVPIVRRAGPVLGTIGVEHCAFDVIVRLARLGIVGVF